MPMRRNVASSIGSNEQGEYCRAALQRSDRKEPRYKCPTLLYLYGNSERQRVKVRVTVRRQRTVHPAVSHESVVSFQKRQAAVVIDRPYV